jgi:hypothetical protein
VLSWLANADRNLQKFTSSSPALSDCFFVDFLCNNELTSPRSPLLLLLVRLAPVASTERGGVASVSTGVVVGVVAASVLAGVATSAVAAVAVVLELASALASSDERGDVGARGDIVVVVVVVVVVVDAVLATLVTDVAAVCVVVAAERLEGRSTGTGRARDGDSARALLIAGASDVVALVVVVVDVTPVVPLPLDCLGGSEGGARLSVNKPGASLSCGACTTRS